MDIATEMALEYVTNMQINITINLQGGFGCGTDGVALQQTFGKDIGVVICGDIEHKKYLSALFYEITIKKLACQIIGANCYDQFPRL